MPEQLLIDYKIECTDLERALAIAEEIALEQTVETPPSLVKEEFFQKSIIGQVIEAQEITADSFKVGIAYNSEKILSRSGRGGVKISTIAQTALEYGRDILLLMGGDLLESVSKLADNTRKIVVQFDRLFPEDRKIRDLYT